jgi:signal transduction histidine kinase
MKSSLRIIYSLIVFILGIVLLSVLTVLLIYENQQTHLSFQQIQVSHEANLQAEKFLSEFRDAEHLFQRSLLDDRQERHREIAAALAILDSLSRKVEAQNRIIKRLKTLLEERNNVWLSDSVTPAPGIRTGALREARALVGSYQSLQHEKLTKSQDFAKRHHVLPAIIGIGISIFAILIFIVAFYFTNAELKKSNHLNDELESKNVQLEKYTKELSSFTEITSHDMQEPLRKIELFISLIDEREKDNLSPRAMEYFSKIKDSVSRMRHLFFSILAFNLADEVRHSKDEIDLNEVLQETLESLKVYIKDTKAVVTNDPLPYVKGVRHQLIQLFENVLSNALKYKRDDATPEIRITCEIFENRNAAIRDLRKETRYYKIDFRDNGIGFDQKYVDKIFEIFQRHVRTENNGVGIGLSICRKIAQNHGGTMTAESEINKGSLFSFYIPA